MKKKKAKKTIKSPIFGPQSPDGEDQNRKKV